MVGLSVLMVVWLAQGAGLVAPSADAKAKAQILVKRGAQDFQHGRYEAALGEFRDAYAIFPSPKLFLNIGQCERELGHAVEAIQAFERFRREAELPPPRLLAEAEEGIAELSAHVGKLRVDCPTPGAEIRLDGKKVGVAPMAEPLAVAPGPHALTATYQGHTAVASNVEVAAGAVEAVVLRADASSSARTIGRNGGAHDGALFASHAPAEGASKGWMLGRTWTWVVLGSAVVLAGGATAAGLVMQSKFNALDQRCGRSSGAGYTGCAPSDFDTLNTWKNTANLLWGLSAAATVTAGVLFYVEGRPLAVAPVLGPRLGVAMSMRY